ncbi:methyltransferase-like protein 23 [Glycine soja]|nr:methyltransferase-like protein 23 [Glycine soja]
MILKRQASTSPSSRFFTSQSHYTLHEFPNQLTITLLLAEHEGRIWPIPVALQRSSRRVCAGTSLPDLVAAKLGACVTLTDDSTRLEVLNNMRRVCDLNKLECNVLGLTWGVWDSSLFSLQPTIILGADVLYDSNAFDNLFATVTFLFRNSPGSTFITSYHNRSGHHLIEFLIGKWGLECLKLLDGFSFLASDKASLLSGNIQLAEISLISKDNARGSSKL